VLYSMQNAEDANSTNITAHNCMGCIQINLLNFSLAPPPKSEKIVGGGLTGLVGGLKSD